MIVDELKKSILEIGIRGKLVDNINNSNIIDDEIEFMCTKYNGKMEINMNPDFDLPNSWRWVKLGNISCSNIGLTYKPSDISDTGIPVLRSNNIQEGKINYDDLNAVNLDINENKLCNIGDILMCSRNGSKRLVGKCALIDKQGYSFGAFMAIIRSDINKYLYYVFNSSYFRKKMLGDASTTTINQITQKMLSNFWLPLPPIEEQQKIVDKIEKVFAKLDEIKPIEQELTELKSKFGSDMRNSILQSAYSGELCNSDDSNWDEDKFIKLMDIYTGNSISETVKKNKYTGLNDGYNYIATKDLEFNHTFNYDNGIKIPFDETGFKYADKDSILMCIEGGSAGKKIGILNEKVCFGNKLCMFKPITGSINHKFIYYYLQSPLFLKNFNDNMTGIIGGVSINKLKKIKIKYPSLEEQQKIVDKIEELLPLCEDIEKLVSK